MANEKVLGKVEVSIGEVTLTNKNGAIRDAGFDSLIYESDRVQSIDDDALLQIKYTSLSEVAIYEGVFDIVISDSVSDSLDGEENILVEDLETAAGEEDIVSSSAFLENSGIDDGLGLVEFSRSSEDTFYGSGAEGYSVIPDGPSIKSVDDSLLDNGLGTLTGSDIIVPNNIDTDSESSETDTTANTEDGSTTGEGTTDTDSESSETDTTANTEEDSTGPTANTDEFTKVIDSDKSTSSETLPFDISAFTYLGGFTPNIDNTTNASIVTYQGDYAVDDTNLIDSIAALFYADENYVDSYGLYNEGVVLAFESDVCSVNIGFNGIDEKDILGIRVYDENGNYKDIDTSSITSENAEIDINVGADYNRIVIFAEDVFLSGTEFSISSIKGSTQLDVVQEFTIDDAALLANDVAANEDDVLSLTIEDSNLYDGDKVIGKVSLDGNGDVVITPFTNADGSPKIVSEGEYATFNYTVSDDSGMTSSAVVTINLAKGVVTESDSSCELPSIDEMIDLSSFTGSIPSIPIIPDTLSVPYIPDFTGEEHEITLLSEVQTVPVVAAEAATSAGGGAADTVEKVVELSAESASEVVPESSLDLFTDMFPQVHTDF